MLREIGQGTMDCVVRSSSPDGLAAIRRPGCAAAICERSPLRDFQSWINELAPDHLPRTRLILRAEMVCDALAEIADVCGTPAGRERDVLVDDVSALSAIFADVMRCDFLRLRLEMTSASEELDFHVNDGMAQLICTYRGIGTQYGVSNDGGNPCSFSTVPTSSPMILRGAHWPETPMSGLLYRAPRVADTQGARLELTLDPVFEPEKEPHRHFLH